MGLGQRTRSIGRGGADPAELAAEADIERLLDETRALWQGVASDRGFSCIVRPFTEGKLCELSCRIESHTVTVVSDGDRARGFDTEARTSSPFAMRGSVLVRPSGDFDRWRRALFGRPRVGIGVEELDAVLSVRASSEALGRAVLDARTVSFLRAVVGRPLRMLRYADGAVAVRWAGIERDVAFLLDAIDLVAHLAVTGTAVTAYR
jgi:hypothetical protein